MYFLEKKAVNLFISTSQVEYVSQEYFLCFHGVTLVYTIPSVRVKGIVSEKGCLLPDKNTRLYVQCLESTRLEGKGLEGIKVRELNHLIEAKYGNTKGYFPLKLYADNPKYIEWGKRVGFIKTLAKIVYKEDSGTVFAKASRGKTLAVIRAEIPSGAVEGFLGRIYSTILSLMFYKFFIGEKDREVRLIPVNLSAKVVSLKAIRVDFPELLGAGILKGEEPKYSFYIKEISMRIRIE
ncbi:MAG: hypothetical protein DRJ52_09665 [Thermoprotei archaeon]|nr:MAG: hypothetical protein DRJ52_09665 [Thermoprotei archaeon]RLF00061.1 MAG: hypothetical protein DRJ63_03465 [Thermoprotei archaeon]